MKRSAEGEDRSESKRNVKPTPVSYWMTTESEHDCFFVVGPEAGTVERIGAIKVFLSGQSEVLRKFFDRSKCALAKTRDIRVRDSDPETFKKFLVCVYGGKNKLLRNLPFEDTLKLLYLCDKYQLLVLEEEISSCILELHQPLSFENAVTALSHPACLNSKSLVEVVSRIVQNNTDKFLTDSPLFDLEPNAVAFIAQQSCISVKEVELWCAVLKWAKKRVGENDKRIRSCVNSIFKDSTIYRAMTCDEFCRYVIPEDILEPKEVVGICKTLGALSVSRDGLDRKFWSRFRPRKQEFMFNHVVHNMNTFSSAEKSKGFFTFHQFLWCVEFSPVENRDATQICLSCSADKNCKTSVKCEGWEEIEVVNHIDKTKSFRLKRGMCFVTDHHIHKSITYLPRLEYFTEMKNGFVKDNSIEIRVRLAVK